MAQKQHRTSMDTILTFDNRDNQSEWSVEWSTTHIPGMDNAAGSARQRRDRGRRRLRIAALALGSCLTMHTRVVGPALTTGLLYFLFLAAAVAGLANPLRHFEVYLGQWSISGPGRAFRILPMLDGIGLAMCISSIIRAINYCTMASIALLYVVNSSSDSNVPFKYCRDWEYKQYDPIKANISVPVSDTIHMRRRISPIDEGDKACTLGLRHRAWRNYSVKESLREKKTTTYEIETCNELYYGGYPSLFGPPAYNYFYVELVQLRPKSNYTFNLQLFICQCCTWLLFWLLMISERVAHGRLIWNNLYNWVAVIPWIWVSFLVVVAICSVSAPKRMFKQLLKLGYNDIFTGICDAFINALYIHSAGTGTELILGKGLNFFASGHIDPLLNKDNVWHSGLVLALAALHAAAATVCALGDLVQPDVGRVYNTRESMMWVIPMYSKCTSMGNYSRAASCIIFGGLSFSYMVVAYSLIKTALHTIFEYRVKLVFYEQQVVAALVISCLLLGLPYATSGGLPLLESVDAMMTGLAMPLVCLAELVALLYLYRSSDFKSDINVATEENTCSTRISTSWQIIPLFVVVLIIGKIVAMSRAEMPAREMALSVMPLLAVALTLPLRAIHNAIVFLHPAPRRGV